MTWLLPSVESIPRGRRVRTVLKTGEAEVLEKMRKERKRITKRLHESTPEQKAKKAARNRKWRAKNAEREREQKRRWRAANREHLRAYYRNYDALTPGRRAYKARWLRERGSA
jgi:Skp family chaperone for outer membrane proteins